jgi:hypothetical protein
MPGHFLGQTMPLMPPTVVAAKFSEPSIASDGAPPFVAVEKSGVMVH